MYEKDDTTHYDYFDYLDDNGNIQQYEPDSDMDFVEFKKTMICAMPLQPKNAATVKVAIKEQRKLK